MSFISFLVFRWGTVLRESFATLLQIGHDQRHATAAAGHRQWHRATCHRGREALQHVHVPRGPAGPAGHRAFLIPCHNKNIGKIIFIYIYMYLLTPPKPTTENTVNTSQNHKRVGFFFGRVPYIYIFQMWKLLKHSAEP